MYDNKQSVMGKWKRVLIAAALTAGMIMALPGWTVGSAQAAPDLDKGCTLIISRPDDSTKLGRVVVDLYRVADAVEVEGYDAYSLEIPESSPYSGLRGDLENALHQESDGGEESGNALYRDLAQKAAKIALEEKQLAPLTNIDLSKFNSKINLEAGMYLVIARGADMSAAQYTTTIMDEDGEKQLVTMAYSNDGAYVYTFLPELIALPSRGGAPSGSFNTADEEAWSYSVKAVLKSEEASRYTSLIISKTFSGIGDAAVIGNDGCVYQVEATLGEGEDAELVYSNVVAINYEGKATGTARLDKVIPVDAKVTVTEVYDGASFEINGDREKVIESAIPDEDNGAVNNRVFFTNDYTGTGTGGDILTNSFAPGEDGWEWYKNGEKQENKPAASQPTE